MSRRSDPNRRGGDAWAFLDRDGKPLTPYLGWLWFETRALRKWTPEHWTHGDTRQRRRSTPTVTEPEGSHV